MLDPVARRLLTRPLDRTAAWIDRSWVSPDRVTVAGLVLGLGSAAAAALTLWPVALVLWLASRLADGLDGPLARRRARHRAGSPTGGPAAGPADGPAEAGGFLDIVCDFTVYGATVVGVAIGVGVDTGVAAWPFLAVLGVYYVNGTAFLAFSSLAERSGRRLDDGRSLSFIGGLAEGTETVVVHALWMLLPGIAAPVAWVWAVVVGLGAAQRVWTGYRLLR